MKKTIKKVVTFREIMLRLSPSGWFKFSLVNHFEKNVTCVGLGSKTALNDILIEVQLDLLKESVQTTLGIICKIKKELE